MNATKLEGSISRKFNIFVSLELFSLGFLDIVVPALVSFFRSTVMDMVVDKKSVEGWFNMIRQGHITLPRFQRDEAWKRQQIEGVLENMLREQQLPIGALLTMEVGDEELFISRHVSSAPKVANSKPKVNLLDGQQRITAIWRALNDTYEDFSVFVSLENIDKPSVDIVRKSVRKNSETRSLPSSVGNPVNALARRKVPAKVLLPGVEGEQFKDKWIREATQGDPEKMIEILNQISNLRGRVAKYHIPYIELPVSVGKETALDIFIKMNVSSSLLKDFDIVVAQLESSTSRSLHDMIAELKGSVPAVKKFGNVEDLALSVGALLNDRPPLKSTYLDKSFGEELDRVWDSVVNGVERGVKFLQSEMMFNEKLIPTEVITNLTCALWAVLPIFGTDEEAVARKIIRKAVWRASFTDRYGRVTSKAFQDFKSIKKILQNPSSQEVPQLFDDISYPLPTEEDLVRSGWPNRRDRLGRAILATSLRDGGLDFASDEKASAENIGDREYHHIFPRALIEDQFPTEAHSALNCALISWRTNRKISAKSPAEYITERAKHANISMIEVKRRLESHLIPFDELMEGDFQAFLKARAKIIHERMTKLAEGERC